ncbi:arf-GAP with Rho-GAP domain, ANK repeat and PH domain-containing protein 2-like [Ochlerotatus camptorhynchus]|uniref:arf-GAP with Rho-GAP domain, ANK repeat and PH domain-containing protein 2-like n=1 Tax=Ochlerotatus camptorhynchus TaxID=644619 RepID=UPI0031E31AA9
MDYPVLDLFLENDGLNQSFVEEECSYRKTRIKNNHLDATYGYMEELDAALRDKYGHCSSSKSPHSSVVLRDSDPSGDIEEILSKAVCDRVSISALHNDDSQQSSNPVEQLEAKPEHAKLDESADENTLIVPRQSLATLRRQSEMVAKPAFTNQSITHKGLAFHSGIILTSVLLKNKTMEVFRDVTMQQNQIKCDLQTMLSLQKFEMKQSTNNENMLCFRVVMRLQKVHKPSDPGLVSPNNRIQNVRFRTQSHSFGFRNNSDYDTWVTKIIQSLTNVFPENCLKDFTVFGWCYLRNSVSGVWSGAWALLVKRTLYIYCDQDRQLKQLDLRKARCIREVQSDDSIETLFVETGPSMFIDCPPYNSMYFIMGTANETQNWIKMTQESSCDNGDTLESQQLTENDVPVLVEKCINFIYLHGFRAQGIHRVSGVLTKVNTLLDAFKKNAFEVQLPCLECNVHDVASALRKFIRDSPTSIFGTYSVRLVSIVAVESITDRVLFYKEILSKLSAIAYNTLKMVIGHLKHIASQDQYNKMGVAGLTTIWSATLLSSFEFQTSISDGQHSVNQNNMISDLIIHYSDIFMVSPEEQSREARLLHALVKIYEANENQQSLVKSASGLQVWITIDDGTSTNDKLQQSVLLTLEMTAADVCKQLADKIKIPWHELTLYEIIGIYRMVRPLHHTEPVLPAVHKWTKWAEEDCINNFLTIRPISTLNDIRRCICESPGMMAYAELYFANKYSQLTRMSQLVLIDQGIIVLNDGVETERIDLRKVRAYFGHETRRIQSDSMRWTVTLIEKETGDAESQFLGHLIGGTEDDIQLLWYSSIWFSLYENDILPHEES